MPDQTTNPIDTEATAEPTLTRRQWTGAVRAGADAIVRLSPNSTAWAKSNAALTAAVPLLEAPAQNRTAAMPEPEPLRIDIHSTQLKTELLQATIDRDKAQGDRDRYKAELADARDAAYRQQQRIEAERAQWQAEIANLVNLIAPYDNEAVISIGFIRKALREGPAPVPGSSRRAQECSQTCTEGHQYDETCELGSSRRAQTAPIAAAERKAAGNG